jgi:hypoxanthine phosphoribosyltransferase
MEESVVKTLYSEEELSQDCALILEEIHKLYPEKKPDFVIAIKKGGVYPGEIIAKALGVEMRSVQASYYDENHQPMDEVRILDTSELEFIPEGAEVVVIDEMFDTGRTMDKIKKLLEAPPYNLITKTAVIHYKSEKHDRYLPGPDIYIRETKDWIVYFWEKDKYEALLPEKPPIAS